MIQHVRCVQPELERLRFVDFEVLADVRIKTKRAWHFECHLSESALSPGFRVLEYDHAIARIAVGVHSVLDGAWRAGRNKLRDCSKLTPQR